MRDEAHVGLVDAHAEGDRRDHHHVVGIDERRLVARPGLRIESGVIGARVEAVRGKRGGGLVGQAARRRIDDARMPLLGVEERRQLARRAGLGLHLVADVGAVEARQHHAVARDAELIEDVGARRDVGGGGQRDPRRAGQQVAQRAQLAVFGAEVVAPLADAMRLVDRHQRDLDTHDQARKLSSAARSGAT